MLTILGGAGCGSRGALRSGEEPIVCEADVDCDQSNRCALQRCIDNACIAAPEIVCSSDDPCSVATCNPESGACESTPLTLDTDRDGFRSPLPGFAPGAVGACGDDCDDTSAAAYPGGMEVCDGVDNDCDGVVDNGSAYLDALRDEIPTALQLAPDLDGSGSRSVAYGDGIFAMSYWGRTEATNGYIHGYSAGLAEVFPSTSVSNVNAPSFGADLAWSGDAFGAIWSDPRVDGNYEIYFARFNNIGEKLGPDLRVTDADDFSIHGRVLFDQGQYALVWDDWRNEVVGEESQIFGQLLTSTGDLVGENIQLTQSAGAAEKPFLASTTTQFGLIYTDLENGEVSLRFQAFDKSLQNPSSVLTVESSDVRLARITPVGELFVVTWDPYDSGPGNTIMGTVVNSEAEMLVTPTALTRGATFARGHDTVSLGDRFVLFWIDDLSGNYELYAKTIGVDLLEIEPRAQLTDDPSDTDSPAATLGDDGRIGVIFDDWRGGTRSSYFVTAGCGEEPLAN